MNYSLYKQEKLFGRYITLKHIEPILNSLPSIYSKSQIGESVNGLPIYKLSVGTGDKKVLMWSQMHGNESTTTKALFDLLNFLSSSIELSGRILEKCELHIIPMLNPDGSALYTRTNFNNVDLNRDAQRLSQPESKALRSVFEEIKPHFGFNLHDQRTIFNPKGVAKPATVSFLAPSADVEKKITVPRRKAMELIVAMNNALQLKIHGQIGRYDDGFNLNCVGDTFQSLKTATILFEAGHYPDDYQREITRELIWDSLITALDYIASNSLDLDIADKYFEIPENEKRFFDILIENVLVKEQEKTSYKDVAVQFKEKLKDDKVIFVPEIKGIGNFKKYFAHAKIDYSDYQKDAFYVNDLDNFWISRFLKDYH
jgi:hypothetical protein